MKKVIKSTSINLKGILKSIKLNESTISMVMGAVILVIVGSLIVKYLKNEKGSIPTNLTSLENSVEMSVKTHKVEKGENLWLIAEQYYGDGFKWVEIATENKLANASIIEEGQELVIPNIDTQISNDSSNENTISSSTYEVTKGDTLWNIAVRSYGDGYQWVKIASENHLLNPNVIHVGNVLILPR